MLKVAAKNIQDAIFTGLYMDDETNAIYMTIWDAQTKITPAICGLGFFTNTLSFVVFLQPSLKGLSCSVYLAAKAVIDFLFLLTVFVMWLSRIEVNAFHTPGICQVVIFFSYLTAFVSIWLAVVLTVENLLCVTKPWYVQRSCNAYSAVIITFIIVILGVILYHFSLWNNGVRSVPKITSSPNISELTFIMDNIINSTGRETTDENFDDVKTQYSYHLLQIVENDTSFENKDGKMPLQNNQVCAPLQEFGHLIIAMTYMDSLITMFIPLLILAINNAMIVLLVVRATKHFRLPNPKKAYQLPGAYLSNQRQASTALKKQASKFLFAVSMTTLLFHLPSHVVRLKSLLVGYTWIDILLQRVCEILYYTHYAIGFFVYIFFGKNFRKVFVRIIVRS